MLIGLPSTCASWSWSLMTLVTGSFTSAKKLEKGDVIYLFIFKSLNESKLMMNSCLRWVSDLITRLLDSRVQWKEASDMGHSLLRGRALREPWLYVRKELPQYWQEKEGEGRREALQRSINCTILASLFCFCSKIIF